VNEILPFWKCVKILDLAILISLPNPPCVVASFSIVSSMFLSTLGETTRFLCLGTLVSKNMFFFAPHNQFNFAKVASSLSTNTSK
jgi:hypothetical protein